MYSLENIAPTAPVPEPKPVSVVEAETETESSNPDILHKIEQQCMKATHVQDGLFWSLFIAHYGFNEYLRNKYNYGKVEIREKQTIGEYVGSCSSLKTNYKWSRPFGAEMIADLNSLPRMPMSGLVGMCAYYKTDIYIVDIQKRSYLSFLGQENVESIVLYRNPFYTRKFGSNEYFIDIGITVQTVDEIREKYVALEHFAKPLKGISTYLKTDLERMAEKTIYVEKPEMKQETYSKQELYNHLLIFLSSSNGSNESK